ncbi:LysR family transcriptional regulator [Variovorax boronicumulans]|uniref:LysR family transcriptional regulator n=1 Tax=Variovorax boronicumulans TaxID=436515 RepID=UPI0036F2BAA8
MTLKQLEAFYWAATCASFALAAQRLHLSTSSLSKRLAELEVSLGAPLFDRAGQRATLTEAGERFLPRAAALLLAADETKRSIGAPASLGGRCTFGIGELSALTWLPQLVAHVGRHLPDLRLEPHVNFGSALDERLRNGELDCAVIAGRSPHHGLISSHTVGQAHFVWVAAPALAGKTTTLGAPLLAQHPIVTLPTGAGTSRLLDEWLMAENLEAPHRLSCNSWGAVAGLLIEGIGVGFLPEGWARLLSRRGDLRILKTRQALPALTYTFQKRSNDERHLLTAMRAVVLASIDFSKAARLL